MNIKKKVLALFIIGWVSISMGMFVNAWGSGLVPTMRDNAFYAEREEYYLNETIAFEIDYVALGGQPNWEYRYAVNITNNVTGVRAYLGTFKSGLTGIIPEGRCAGSEGFAIKETWEVNVTDLLGVPLDNNKRYCLRADFEVYIEDVSFFDNLSTYFHLASTGLTYAGISADPISIVYGDNINISGNLLYKSNNSACTVPVYWYLKTGSSYSSPSLLEGNEEPDEDGAFQFSVETRFLNNTQIYDNYYLYMFSTLVYSSQINVTLIIPVNISKLNLNITPALSYIEHEIYSAPSIPLNLTFVGNNGFIDLNPDILFLSNTGGVVTNSLTKVALGTYLIIFEPPVEMNTYTINLVSGIPWVNVSMSTPIVINATGLMLIIDSEVSAIKYKEDLDFDLIFKEFSGSQKVSWSYLNFSIQTNNGSHSVDPIIRSEDPAGYSMSVLSESLNSIYGFWKNEMINFTIQFPGNLTHYATTYVCENIPVQHATELKINKITFSLDESMNILASFKDRESETLINSTPLFKVEICIKNVWNFLTINSTSIENNNLTIKVDWSEIEHYLSDINANSSKVRIGIDEDDHYCAVQSNELDIVMASNLRYEQIGNDSYRSGVGLTIVFQLYEYTHDYETNDTYLVDVSAGIVVEFLINGVWKYVTNPQFIDGNHTYKIIIEWDRFYEVFNESLPFGFKYRIRCKNIDSFPETVFKEYDEHRIVHHSDIIVSKSIITPGESLHIEFEIYDTTNRVFVRLSFQIINFIVKAGIINQSYDVNAKKEGDFSEVIDIPWEKVKNQELIKREIIIIGEIGLWHPDYLLPTKFEFPIYINTPINLTVKLAIDGKKYLYIYPIVKSEFNQNNYWNYFNYNISFPGSIFNYSCFKDVANSRIVLDYDILAFRCLSFQENGSIKATLILKSLIPSFSDVVFSIDVKFEEIEQIRSAEYYIVAVIVVGFASFGAVSGGAVVITFAGKQYRRMRKKISAEELFCLD